MYLQQNQGLSLRFKYYTWGCNHCERENERKDISIGEKWNIRDTVSTQLRVCHHHH